LPVDRHLCLCFSALGRSRTATALWLRRNVSIQSMERLLGFSLFRRYHGLLWFFLVGCFAPIPFYFLARRFPLSYWRYVNIPVFFAGIGAIPPGTGINYASWALTGFIFNFVIRRNHFRWWMRYNYILSAALGAGVAISAIVIFFTVQYPKGGFNVNWWGNDAWQNTADALGTPMYVLNPGETFGPSSWS
jgi:hypothetical protein